MIRRYSSKSKWTFSCSSNDNLNFSNLCWCLNLIRLSNFRHTVNLFYIHVFWYLFLVSMIRFSILVNQRWSQKLNDIPGFRASPFACTSQLIVLILKFIIFCVCVQPLHPPLTTNVNLKFKLEMNNIYTKFNWLQWSSSTRAQSFLGSFLESL